MTEQFALRQGTQHEGAGYLAGLIGIDVLTGTPKVRLGVTATATGQVQRATLGEGDSLAVPGVGTFSVVEIELRGPNGLRGAGIELRREDDESSNESASTGAGR